MPPPKKKKALLTDEAIQTGTLASLGLACIAVMLIGGIFAVIGLVLAVGCSVLIVILHRDEIVTALRARKSAKHLAFPLASAAVILILGVMVANRDTILAWRPWVPGSPVVHTGQDRVTAARQAGERAVQQFDIDPEASTIGDPDCRDCTGVRKACEKKREKLIESLNALIYEADTAQYYYQLDRNTDVLHDKYVSWLARVTSVLARNPSAYISQDEFAAASEPGTQPTDIESQFRAKEIVLKDMTQKASDGLCNHKVITGLEQGTF